MSEIVIDSKEFREYWKNLEVYKLAVAMTAIFRHKGNCLMYCQDYSHLLSKKLRASEPSIESFLSKKINTEMLFSKAQFGNSYCIYLMVTE